MTPFARGVTYAFLLYEELRLSIKRNEKEPLVPQ
jgi:hypothetical protein